jgi:hypothetical protein
MPPTKALQTEAFHHLLWPGQTSCPGHGGYKIIFKIRRNGSAAPHSS